MCPRGSDQLLLRPGNVKMIFKCISRFKTGLAWIQICRIFRYKTGLAWVQNMSSKHLFGLWLGVIKQQAMTWTNVDQDSGRHMESLVRSQ